MRDPAGRNKEAARILENQGVYIVDIDVTNDTSVTEGVTEAVEKMGSVDILINNAGVGAVGIQEGYTA
jgi:NADP-dependent 3-hydroxy acid dehydrogenase YdfG